MKKNAFTLIETLIAIAILAISMTILSGLQVRSFIKTLKGQQDISRVFLIKKELVKIFLYPTNKTKPIIQEIEDLDLTIKSEILDIEKKSSLRDFEKDLKIVKSVGNWTSDLGDREIKMIGLILQPEEKKK